MNEQNRLNKFLALHAGISRREADDLIKQGRVAINGIPAKIGARISIKDHITVNGKSLDLDTKLRYIVLNKPVGYVCSRKKQGQNPTIYDLLPPELRELKTVGRLDRDSSGLILLTNDGDYAQSMTHPRYHKLKQYDAVLDKPLEPLHQQMISDFGVDLEDGKSQLRLERLADDRLRWTVTMQEGRNRQIRRTFSALGYTVKRLHRTHFGPYFLSNVQPGQYIYVDKI